MNPPLQTLFPTGGPSSAPTANNNHIDSSSYDGRASQAMNGPTNTNTYAPPSMHRPIPVPAPVPVPFPIPTRMVTDDSSQKNPQIQQDNQNQNRPLRTSLNDRERDTFSASYNDSADGHSLAGSYTSLQMKQMKLDFEQQNLELEKRQLRQKMILLQEQRKMQEQIYYERKRLSVPTEGTIKRPLSGLIDLSQSGSGSDEETVSSSSRVVNSTYSINHDDSGGTEGNTKRVQGDQFEADGGDEKVNSDLSDPRSHGLSTFQSEPTGLIDDSVSLRAAYLYPDRSQLKYNNLIMNTNISNTSEGSSSNRSGTDFGSSSSSNWCSSSSSSSVGYNKESSNFSSGYIPPSIPMSQNPFFPHRQQTLDPTHLDAHQMSDSEGNLSDGSEASPNVSKYDAQNIGSELLEVTPSTFATFSSLLSDPLQSVTHYTSPLISEPKSTTKGDTGTGMNDSEDRQGQLRQSSAAAKTLPMPSIKSFTPLGSSKKVSHLITFFLV